jgi:hypothetical protein
VTPPGAVVDVDRETLGGREPDRSIRVDPGEHVVVAHAPGFREERRAMRLAAGEHARLVMALEALPERARSAPGFTSRAAPPAARAVTPSRTGPIVLVALGGASLAGAAITGALAGSLDRRIRERCTGTVCPADLGDDQSRMLGLATASDVLLVAGAGLAGAGVTWWLLAPTRTSTTTAALSLVPSGARLGGTF